MPGNPFITFRSKNDFEWGRKDSIQASSYTTESVVDSRGVKPGSEGIAAEKLAKPEENLREAITGICHKLVTLGTQPFSYNFIRNIFNTAATDNLIQSILGSKPK